MRDLFDRQMEIGDELIDRKLPTHIKPNSSSMDKHQTTVVFRKYPDGSIIALFPSIKGSNYRCGCYQHVGQHGEADYQGVIASTKPAQPWGFQALRNELESIGYNLRVLRKKPRTIAA